MPACVRAGLDALRASFARFFVYSNIYDCSSTVFRVSSVDAGALACLPELKDLQYLDEPSVSHQLVVNNIIYAEVVPSDYFIAHEVTFGIIGASFIKLIEIIFWARREIRGPVVDS